MILNRELFEDLLELEDELRSPAVLLADVLEVDGVLNIQSHVHLVHIHNVLHHYAVVRLPMGGLTLDITGRPHRTLLVGKCMKNQRGALIAS